MKAPENGLEQINRTLNKLRIIGIDIEVERTKKGLTARINRCKREVERLLIPEGINRIEDGDIDFNERKNIKNIVLPETLREVGQKVFRNCIELRSINIPSNLKYIEKEAFLWCGKMKINGTLENIEVFGNNCFSSSSLSGRIVLSGKAKIIEGAFKGTDIEEVEIK